MPERPVVNQIRTPEALASGVYANGVGVGISKLDFTIDFLVNLPPEEGALPDGQAVVVSPQQVVSRIKVNPSLAFQIARNLAVAMDAYEAQFGKIEDM